MKTVFADSSIIGFIWSQHDGGNVEQRQWLRFPPKPHDAKAKQYKITTQSLPLANKATQDYRVSIYIMKAI